MFQELNRLRKAALAFGFLDLLKGVADMLERECTLLPDTAHPDAAFQLTHAAQQLKLDKFHKFRKPLSMRNVSEGPLKSLCEVCRE